MSNGTGTTTAERGTATVPYLAPPCRIRITSTAAERSFRASQSPTVSWKASLSGNQPHGSRIVWDLLGGTNATGTISYTVQDPLTLVVRADHPNMNRLRVRVEHQGVILCEDTKLISVPQYFWITSTPRTEPFADDPFLLDLERLGLRRRPPSDGFLTPEQEATNHDVAEAVVQEIFETVLSLFSGVNVRFSQTFPTAFVDPSNITTVIVGGMPSPNPNIAGHTSAPTGIGRSLDVDIGNLEPAQYCSINSGLLTAGDWPAVYHDIFGSTAIEDRDGRPLPSGSAVDAGDFARIPTTVRQRTVDAAIKATGRWIGSVIAHECGHALGLDHNNHQTGEIMDAGVYFSEYIGIRSFDPRTGHTQLGNRVRFGRTNYQRLVELLPILSYGVTIPRR
jgi:hypothetical protein